MLCIIRGFRGIVEGKGNMRDRFDIEQVLRITGLGIRADQSDGGADFDVACSIAVKKIWKAKEYEDLEEQNRLIKLPCAVGDTVYRINKGKKEPIIPMLVIGIAIRNENELVIQTKDIADDNHNLYSKNSIGKTVFLTKEEAESALEELERGKG